MDAGAAEVGGGAIWVFQYKKRGNKATIEAEAGWLGWLGWLLGENVAWASHLARYAGWLVVLFRGPGWRPFQVQVSRWRLGLGGCLA